MITLHHYLGWVVIAANLVAGIWALASHWVDGIGGRALWGFVGVSQVLVIVQVTLGAWLVGGQGIEANDFHAFYGFVAFASVAILYSYRKQVPDSRLLYGGGCLWVMGLALRAATLI